MNGKIQHFSKIRSFHTAVLFVLVICKTSADDGVDQKILCNVTDSSGTFIRQAECKEFANIRGDKSTKRTHIDSMDHDMDHEKETEIKYGLVPAFLIGASSVIVIYIVSHCLYLHCYAKRKMRHMAENHATETQEREHQNQQLLNAAHAAAATHHQHGHHNNHNAMTSHTVPSVVTCEDGAYGKTTLMQPYVMCPTSDTDIGVLPNSTSNLGAVIPSSDQQSNTDRSRGGSLQETSLTLEDGTSMKPRAASICFLPIGTNFKEADKTGTCKSEWTPVQGYLYSHDVSGSGVALNLENGTLGGVTIDPEMRQTLAKVGSGSHILFIAAGLETSAAQSITPVVVDDTNTAQQRVSASPTSAGETTAQQSTNPCDVRITLDGTTPHGDKYSAPPQCVVVPPTPECDDVAQHRQFKYDDVPVEEKNNDTFTHEVLVHDKVATR